MAIKYKYRKTVGAAAKAAGLIGVPGAFSFGLDVTAVGGIWVGMLIKLARDCGHDLDRAQATKLVGGVLAGTAAYVTGSKIAMKLLHAIPIAGSLAAMGVNGALNYVFTYKFGHAMSKLLDHSGFDRLDLLEMGITAATLVAGLPSADEISDLIALAAEPVDTQLLAAFRRTA